MSEEAIRAELKALAEKIDTNNEEVRRYIKENKETHKELYNRVGLLERAMARMELVSRGTLFVSGTAVGVIVTIMIQRVLA